MLISEINSNVEKYEFGWSIPVKPECLFRWFDDVTNQVHVLVNFLKFAVHYIYLALTLQGR